MPYRIDRVLILLIQFNNIIKANELLQHLYSPPPKGAFNNNDVEVVEGVEEYNEMLLLEEYKLAQQAIL